jgi:hypothetical protein
VIVAMDPERVEESNLQRYVLAGDADVGVAKTALVKRAVEDDVGFGRKRHSASALQLFCQPGPVGNGNPASPSIRMYPWKERSLRSLRHLARICMMATMALVACGTSPQTGPTPQGGGPAFEMTVLGQTACPAALDAASCVRVRVTNRGTSGDGRCRLRGEATASGGATQDVWGRWVVLNNIEHGVSVIRVTPWDGGRPAVGYCEPGLHS